MQALFQKLLFQLDPERAHEVALAGLDVAAGLGLARRYAQGLPALPVEVMGLRFANPVGLAAGLDKNGDHIDALFALGFGFVEIGTVTPRPQPGNDKPRLFRLPAASAVINRMGFNNAGVEHLVERVRRARRPGVLGINIGKNRDTPLEHALDDYRLCLQAVHAVADYVTVNLSSPNTPGLRALQTGEALQRLLAGLQQEREALEREQGRRVPIVIKIAPDMDEPDLRQLARTVLDSGMDGLAATNTTVDHAAVAHLPYGTETGGLSGQPLKTRATEVVVIVSDELAGRLPVIGVGGIASADDALEKLQAGARLVQLYTGLVYGGPALPGRIVRGLAGHPGITRLLADPSKLVS